MPLARRNFLHVRERLRFSFTNRNIHTSNKNF
jgi:hypothetical protein